MAVTAAPTRKVYPVAWMSSRETLWAGFGRHRNRFLMSVISIFNGDNIFVTSDHIQPGSRRELDSSGICAKFLDFGFQRLVYISQRFDVRLHYCKLLRGNLNFGVCSHVDCHADSQGRQQNHSKNHPGGNYSPASPHLRARSKDIDRDLLH